MDLSKYREWLKANWDELEKVKSDQQQKVEYPALEKPLPEDAVVLDLPSVDSLELGTMSLSDAIFKRESRRKFSDDALTLNELSYLLWATQGVRHIAKSGVATLRTVPSGGARHSFETYLAVDRVEGLEPGLYRYVALEHKLAKLKLQADIGEECGEACLGQRTVKKAAVNFIWATIPYRAEWRYVMAAHKMIAIDAGHVCQNLYLACEALGLGCCGIGAYLQEPLDKLIGVDGQDEFAVYAGSVGRVE